ncbi:MAG: T9SS type A sorting domain-containing protein [bacterium]|nr:T9SS type A sorting domain-containing protein [bacterium]
MKYCKSLFIIFFIFNLPILKSQFLIDSLRITGIQYYATVSPGYPYDVRYYCDSITLDSMIGINEFYTVERRISSKFINSSKSNFKIRVNSKKIYFTGTINYGQPTKIFDKLIYDFNHFVGDTFVIRLTNDTLLDIHLKVDSIKQILYQDGIARTTHYYIRTQNNYYSQHPFYCIEGAGSNLGLIHLNIDNFPSFNRNELVSICKPNQIILGNNDCSIGNYAIKPYCEEDSLKAQIIRAEKASIDQKLVHQFIKLFPNPTNDLITINSKMNGIARIIDYSGKTCVSELGIHEGDNHFSLRQLTSGIYFIIFQFNQATYSQKITIDCNL